MHVLLFQRLVIWITNAQLELLVIMVVNLSLGFLYEL
jgi:hypothetical protein